MGTIVRAVVGTIVGAAVGTILRAVVGTDFSPECAVLRHIEAKICVQTQEISRSRRKIPCDPGRFWPFR